MFSQDTNWENLLNKFFLKESQVNLIKDSSWLLLISAGSDSIAVLKFLLKIQQNYNTSRKLLLLYIDHYNKPNTAREEILTNCFNQASSISNLSVKLIIVRRDIPVISEKLNQNFERLASQLRYKITKRIARQHEVTQIFTGHNLSDWFETAIMRFNRGSSIDGLVPMSFMQKRQDTHWIRPLYLLTKNEIIQELTNRSISYWNDPENQNQQYRRNQIRELQLINNPSGLRVTASNLLLHRVKDYGLYKEYIAQIHEVKPNFEYKLYQKTIQKAPEYLQQKIKIYVLKTYLGLEYFSKRTREQLKRSDFQYQNYYMHTETQRGKTFLIFRKGQNNILNNYPKIFSELNRKNKIIKGSLISQKYKIKYDFGHKSVRKIFNEKKLSVRQIANTICILANDNDKLVTSIKYLF